jgi:hypothetical protein
LARAEAAEVAVAASRTALEAIIVASEAGSASDAIQDMLDIARAALGEAAIEPAGGP